MFNAMESQMKDDTILDDLQAAINPIVTIIDQDETAERAVLCVAGRDEYDEKGNAVGVQTFIDCAGDFGLIQEALYTELTSLIEKGEPLLFESIRAVIKQIEEEENLSDGETLTSNQRYLH